MKVVYLGLLIIALVILFTLLGTLVWGKKNHNGTFVINSQSSKNNLIYSEDAETWTAAVDEDGNNPFGDTGAALDVHWARGRWVAVGNPESDNGNTMAWSDDAKTWTYGTGQNFGTTVGSTGRFVRFGDGLWVAGGTPGTSGNSVLKYSSDGKSWNDASGEPFGDGTSGTCSAIAFHDDLWVAGGNNGGSGPKIFYSSNGIRWTAATGTPFGSATSVPIVFAYGNDRWVAVGNDVSGSGSLIWYSDNGKAWSESTHPFTSSASTVWDIKYYGGLFVASGVFGTGGTILAYSTDGITFTAAEGLGTLAVGYYIDNVMIPSNGYWLANGTDGTDGIVYRSTDGINWTDVTPDTFFPGPSGLSRGETWGKVYRGKKYRAVVTGSSATANANIYWTENGTDWNQVSETLIGAGSVSGTSGLEVFWAPAPA